MRVFKKGRGQRDIFSYIFGNLTGSGHRWQIRDVVVDSNDELKWFVPNGPVDKLTEEELNNTARESVSLKDCTVSSVSVERSPPQAVVYQLGDRVSEVRFYTISVQVPGSEVPLVFGFVDKDMIENLQDQIRNGIEHSQWTRGAK